MLLQDRYEIDDLHMNGGMSQIHRGRDKKLNDRLIAIKSSQLNGNAETNDLARFHHKREVEFLSSLSHPNLPHIYDHFEHEGILYIVEEFIHGKNLEVYIEDHGALSEVQALDIIHQVAEAINSCHDYKSREGTPDPIYHLDIKPANVLYDGKTAKVIDFGISDKSSKSKLTQLIDPANFGTPGYAAPEQYKSQEPDARTDVYAIGALLYYLLTADNPLEADKRSENSQLDLSDHISKETSKIVRIATSVLRGNRYQTIAGLLDDIKEAKMEAGNLLLSYDKIQMMRFCLLGREISERRLDLEIEREAANFDREEYHDKGVELLRLIDTHIGSNSRKILNQSLLLREPADYAVHYLYGIAKLAEGDIETALRMRELKIPGVNNRYSDYLSKSLLNLMLENFNESQKLYLEVLKNLKWINGLAELNNDGTPYFNLLLGMNFSFRKQTKKAGVLLDNIRKQFKTLNCPHKLLVTPDQRSVALTCFENSLQSLLAYSIEEIEEANKILLYLKKEVKESSRIELMLMNESSTDIMTKDGVALSLAYLALGGSFDKFLSESFVIPNNLKFTDHLNEILFRSKLIVTGKLKKGQRK